MLAYMQMGRPLRVWGYFVKSIKMQACISFHLNGCFILLVNVKVDARPILGSLGVRWEYTLVGTAVHCISVHFDNRY